MSKPDLREATSAHEPLLPIEKKLIGWSLGAGLALLALLVVVNHFVPLTRAPDFGLQSGR
jgi:hypothetical protein